jgi:hypothetical protein
MTTKDVLAISLSIITGGYMIPTTIALVRNRPNTSTIALINILVGWTVVGWIIALVMSLKDTSLDTPQ